jgi:hypothetical protein
MAGPGLLVLAIALGGYALAPADPSHPGKRVEADSYTSPREIARCISYNITRKMPNLNIRSRTNDISDESGLLVLTETDPIPATFGVIRVDPSDTGSHLTTWLAGRNLTAVPDELARRLIAGC